MRTWQEVNGVQTGELGGKGSMSGQHGMGGRGGEREEAAHGRCCPSLALLAQVLGFCQHHFCTILDTWAMSYVHCQGWWKSMEKKEDGDSGLCSRRSEIIPPQDSLIPLNWCCPFLRQVPSTHGTGIGGVRKQDISTLLSGQVGGPVEGTRRCVGSEGEKSAFEAALVTSVNFLFCSPPSMIITCSPANIGNLFSSGTSFLPLNMFIFLISWKIIWLCHSFSITVYSAFFPGLRRNLRSLLQYLSSKEWSFFFPHPSPLSTLFFSQLHLNSCSNCPLY